MKHQDWLGNEFKSHNTVVKVRIKPMFTTAGYIWDGKFIRLPQKDYSGYWEIVSEFTYDEFIKKPYVRIEMDNGTSLVTPKFDMFEDLVSDKLIIFCIKGVSDDPGLYYFNPPSELI